MAKREREPLFATVKKRKQKCPSARALTPQQRPAPVRIKIVQDEYPDLSYLEQWNTPEKYYGGAPRCGECGGDMTYVSNHEWRCSAGDLEDCDNDELSYHDGAGNSDGGQVVYDGRGPVGVGGCNFVPFEDYMRYWGDPNQHISLCVIVEVQCVSCKSWRHGASLGGCDFMVDGGDWKIGTFTVGEIRRLGKMYAYLKGEIAGLIKEARG